MKKLLLSGLVLAAFATSAYANCFGGPNNVQLFCGYEGDDPGCYKMQDQWGNGGKSCSAEPSDPGCIPCAEKVANCETTSGTLYTGPQSMLTAVDKGPDYGKRLNCVTLGGTECVGCSGTKDPNADEDCGAGCDWGGGDGCQAIFTDKTGKDQPDKNPVLTCADAISKCSSYGDPCTLVSPIRTTFLGQATGNALIAMSNAVNLQVTGMATFSIFDMKGKAVRTQRIWESGSHLVSLQELPRGLYVVQATSGSWKQTVKVTVK
jgi:hypothetical protein